MRSIKPNLTSKRLIRALSVLNQAIPFIVKKFTELMGSNNVHLTTGYNTANVRRQFITDKNWKTNPCHDVDAYIIACSKYGDSTNIPQMDSFKIKQYRRHERSLINSQKERTYKDEDGTIVAKNRKKRFEQTVDSLEDWFKKEKAMYGELTARQHMLKLKVIKSTRSYNNPDRVLPGAVFSYKGQP